MGGTGVLLVTLVDGSLGEEEVGNKVVKVDFQYYTNIFSVNRHNYDKLQYRL